MHLHEMHLPLASHRSNTDRQHQQPPPLLPSTQSCPSLPETRRQRHAPTADRSMRIPQYLPMVPLQASQKTKSQLQLVGHRAAAERMSSVVVALIVIECSAMSEDYHWSSITHVL